MNNQEAKKILQRDLAILIENKSLPDGIEAMKVAISALGAIEQFRWERDVAIGQLRELGLSLGANTEEIQKAVNIYKKIPEVIEELEGLKMSMDGQIFNNQSSRLIYEEKMESVNDTVNEAISIAKQLLKD